LVVKTDTKSFFKPFQFQQLAEATNSIAPKSKIKCTFVFKKNSDAWFIYMEESLAAVA
jgi:hypothetical protein